jgi:hypothetical protein
MLFNIPATCQVLFIFIVYIVTFITVTPRQSRDAPADAVFPCQKAVMLVAAIIA